MVLSRLFVLTFAVAAAGASAKGNPASWTFTTAKSKMYALHKTVSFEKTVYCNCPYSNKEVNLGPCGVKAPKDFSDAGKNRFKRTEAEHMVPAALMCGSTPGWTGTPSLPKVCKDKNKKAGRTCAEISEPCKAAFTDVHNLWPAVGGINGVRSDHPYVQDIPEEPREYGRCDFEVEKSEVELPPESLGIAGRVSFYMYDAYHTTLGSFFTKEQVNMFKSWNCGNRPSQLECSRNEAAKALQGNYNHITKSACDNLDYHKDPYCEGYSPPTKSRSLPLDPVKRSIDTNTADTNSASTGTSTSTSNGTSTSTSNGTSTSTPGLEESAATMRGVSVWGTVQLVLVGLLIRCTAGH